MPEATVNDASRDVSDAGSLPSLLAQRARAASDRRLAIEASAGIVAAAASSILRPPLWFAGMACGVCVACFGLWGILDREVRERTGNLPRRSLLAARLAVAILGAMSALAAGFTLFFGTLGTWIS
jgi:hypothetical protein